MHVKQKHLLESERREIAVMSAASVCLLNCTHPHSVMTTSTATPAVDAGLLPSDSDTTVIEHEDTQVATAKRLR